MDVADGTKAEVNYDVSSLKHTEIVVWVEEALQDLLVVSFVYGNVSFQGVLLHSNRKKWPYGVMTPSISAFSASDKQPGETAIAEHPAEAVDDENKLFAVSRRFTYLDGQPTNIQLTRTSLLPRRTNNRRFDRNARTMRLRPRQVLCSKCKSICNENSENVEVVNAARRESEVERNGCALQRSTRRTDNLSPVEKTGTDQSCDNKLTINCRKRSLVTSLPRVMEAKKHKDDKSPAAHKATEEKSTSGKITSSKEAPIMAKTTPFIKISFGPQGTIVKIPPRTRTYTASDTDASTGEGGTTPPQVQLSAALSPSHSSSVAAKAAKKALKKAKKEARRKMNLPNQSPLAHLEIQKQRHHKHKFKHKRKHKENDKEPNASEIGLENVEMENGEMENWDCNNVSQMVDRCSGDNNNESEYNDLIKKECLKQKLSISLKRLSEKSYTKSSSSASHSGNSSNSEDSNSSNKSATTSNSEAEEVPEFPENEMSDREIRPLMMRIVSHVVNKCTLEDGRAMSVGDVVWGKIHGFPWWPGKVLSITVSQRDNGILINQQAHVAWFGSSTSSCMPCRHLVPFLEDFQTRYNKKKRGPYKEAIKQAIRAAQVNANGDICDLSVQL
ncbi:hypothetical protein CHUAL_007469 [Chamberlinius hualienensis]